MKTKFIKFLFLCLGIFCGVSASYAETLRIGGPDGASYGPAPFTPFYRYSFSQVIYTKTELASMAEKQITELTYPIYKGSDKSVYVDVYLSYIENDDFQPTNGTTYNFIPLTVMSKVYSGTFTPSKDGNNTISLQTPFTYDGSKNLLITFSAPVRMESTASSSCQFLYSSTEKLQQLYYQDDKVSFDKNGVPSSAKGNLKQRPNTIFTYRDIPTTPVLNLSNNVVDFGFKKINDNYTLNLQATNLGVGTLTISEIENMILPFSSNSSSISLSASESAPLIFTYAPTEAIYLNQSVTIKSTGGEAPLHLIGHAYPENGWVESFETASLPNLWRTRKNLWNISTNGGYHELNCIKVSSTKDTLITPKTQNGEFAFYVRTDNENTKTCEIIYSTDLLTWTSLKTTSDFTLEAGKYNKQTVDLSTIAQNAFIGIVGQNISVDYCLLSNPIRPEKDIYLTSILTPNVLNEKTEVAFTTKIKNWGNNDISSFKLELRNAETDALLKDSTYTKTLISMNDAEIMLNWFPVPGIKNIYIKAILEGDSDATNDKSEIKSINVIRYEAVMSIAKKELNFDLLFADRKADTIILNIKNTGIATVEVTAVKCNLPFGITTPTFTIDANSNKDVKIFFAQNTPKFYIDSLVFVFEGSGDSIVKVQGTIQRNGDLFESFEGEEFPPLMWRQTLLENTNRWKPTNSLSQIYKGNFSAYQNNSSLYDTLITPKLRVEENEILSFYAKHWGNNGAVLNVIYSPDLINWVSLAILEGSNGNGLITTSSMKNFNIVLPQGNYYIGFAGYKEAVIDYITGPQIIYPDKDLKFISSVIPSKGNVNNAMEIKVNFQNLGNLPTDNYSIQLVQGEKVLAQTNGVEINKLEKKEVIFEFIPTQTTLLEDVFIRLVLDGDEDLANNIGPKSNILINDEFFGEFLVGETAAIGNSTIPFSVNYKYSLTEMLYYPSELGFTKGSSIKGLTYYYSPADYSLPIRMWIGETSESSLETKWIEASTLQQVILTDTAKFVSGGGVGVVQMALPIVFDQPYIYQGGNLVVLIEREKTSDYKNISFYNSKDATHNYRSRYFQSDSYSGSFDPLQNITHTATTSNVYPMTLFSVDKPVSLVSGHVKNDEGEFVKGAAISLKNGAIIYRDTTNQAGYFEIKMSATSKDYTLNVEVLDYIFAPRTIYIPNSDLDLGDLIVAGETFTYNVFIQSANKQSLKGSVVQFKPLASIETILDTLNTEKDSITMTYKNLAKGNYSLSVKNRDFKTYINASISITDNQLDTIVLQEKDTFQVKGKVIAAYNKEVLQGAIVRFTSDQIILLDTTDINGEYSFFTNKTERTYQVEVKKSPSFKTFTSSVIISSLVKDTVLASFEMDLVNIIYTINVSTSDLANANGASVQLTLKDSQNPNTEIVTNGKVIFDNLLPGNYILEVSKEGYIKFTDSNVNIIQVGSENVVLNKIPSKPQLILSVEASTKESLKELPIALENNKTGAIYERTLNSEGLAVFEDLLAGTYTLNIFKKGFKRYMDAAIVILDSVNLKVTLQEIIVDPYELNANVIYSEENASASMQFKWNDIGEYLLDSYEDYPDFAIEFSPWKMIDNDKLGVVAINDKVYPNMGKAQAATIFNPLAMTPIMEDAFARPYSGKKCLIFFGAVKGANDDWAISPKRMVREGDVVAFTVKQLYQSSELEKFEVYISTTGNNLEDFHKVSAGNFLSVGSAEWALFVGDLAEYIGQEIHIAIHCISESSMALMIDDFYIGKPTSENIAKAPRWMLSAVENNSNTGVQSYKIYLNGELKDSTKVTSYNFANIEPNTYTLGVKAIYRSGESTLKTIQATVEDIKLKSAKFTAQITTNANESANGTLVTLMDTVTKEIKSYTVTDGKVQINYLRKGVYHLHIEKQGFTTIFQEIVFDAAKNLNYELIEIIKAPVNAFITLNYTSSNTADANFSWDKEVGYKEGFENFTDFTQVLSPWLNLDKDQFLTYGLSNCTFPGAQQKLAGIVFNTATTTPAITEDAFASSHSGEKHLIFISSQEGACNDWLISPAQEIRDNYELAFFAKSYADLYGLENMNILISESDTHENSFKKIESLQLPTEWTEYKIDLSKYNGKTIYIAFNYVSNNKFYMLLDDISIGSKTPAPNPNVNRVQNYKIFLNGELKATQKESEYVFKNLGEGKYIAGVQAIYVSGLSDTTYYAFEVKTTSLNPLTKVHSLNLYPNPVSGQNLNVSCDESMDYIRIVSVDGKIVYQNTFTHKQKSVEITTTNFNTGIYIIEVKTSTGTQQSRFVVY